jgi:2-oxoglutarate ferredoxin oxidoreductase subunit beta
LVFGAERDKGIRLEGMTPQIVSLNDGKYTVADLWIHDEKDIFKATMLTHFFDDPRQEGSLPRPFGVIYAVERPTYESMMQNQLTKQVSAKQIWI